MRNIYFVNHKKTNFQPVFFSWILPHVFDGCRRMRLVNGQGEQASCLSVAWLKMLRCFEVGNATQERLIIERFLVRLQSESQVSPEVVHAALGVIHEMVYSTICNHIRQKTFQPTELRSEIRRYFIQILQCCHSLKETLRQKKGHQKDDRWWRKN